MKLVGKDIHVIVDQYDVSPDFSALTLNEGVDTLDVTGFTDQAHNYTPGLFAVTTDLSGYYNPATNRNFDVLKAIGTTFNRIISFPVGQNAAPALGDPVFSMVALHGKLNTSFTPAGLIQLQAGFVGRGTTQIGKWGVVLEPGATTRVNTLTGVGVNNGAATTNGGVGTLHITAGPNASATVTFKIQHSSDSTNGSDGTWGDLATFTANGSSLTAEFQAVAAGTTVNKWLRCLATFSGADATGIKFWMTFWRA